MFSIIIYIAAGIYLVQALRAFHRGRPLFGYHRTGLSALLVGGGLYFDGLPLILVAIAVFTGAVAVWISLPTRQATA